MLEDFNNLDQKGLEQFIAHYGLAMDLDDIKFLLPYFKENEHRDPTITEAAYDRYLLVGSLPPHHLLHADLTRSRLRTAKSRAAL